MPAIDWPTLQPNVSTILAAEPNPVGRLAAGDVAALIVRQAFPAADCAAMVERLIGEELMFAGDDPRVYRQAIKNEVIGKYLGRGVNPDKSARKRIDIGTSLGNLGDDKSLFLEQAAETHSLFDRLFAEHPNPIHAIYDNLQQLAPGKKVVTAYEPDGRKYGPAIFRVHYGGFTYGPHFDSVRNREQRTNYAVHRFDRQLAGVLCLQNTTLAGKTAQGIVHRRFWNEEVDPHLKNGGFHDFAAQENIPSAGIELEPGDLYFFNTGMIHEVPGVPGELPRIVLAVFIGYSDDEEEVMVWS